jgi:hypothetical protein
MKKKTSTDSGTNRQTIVLIEGALHVFHEQPDNTQAA